MLRVLSVVLIAPAVAAGIAWSATSIVGRPAAYAGPPPEGLVWAGRVFTARPELAAWLGHRHVAYGTWRARHPRAAARLEHRRRRASA